jgi:sporulation protein YabP
MPAEKKTVTAFTGGQKAESKHRITVQQRNSAALTGVTDVISFDESSVIAETESGVVIIKGMNLHISNLNLDSGELDLDGEIDSFAYDNRFAYGKNKQSLLSRIFK